MVLNFNAFDSFGPTDLSNRFAMLLRKNWYIRIYDFAVSKIVFVYLCSIFHKEF